MPRDTDRLKGLDAMLAAAIGRGDVSGQLRARQALQPGVDAISRLSVHSALVESLSLRFGPSLRVACGQVATRSLPDRHKDLVGACAPATHRLLVGPWGTTWRRVSG